MDDTLFRAAESIRRSGSRFVTGDAVVEAVGGPHSVPALRQAGAMLPRCLAYLFDVQRRLDAFVACFFATRAIATYADLESECVALLNRNCVPTLRQVMDRQKSDPAEISLDDDEQEGDGSGLPADSLSVPLATRFIDFGLGPLHLHPLVSNKYPCKPLREPVSLAQIISVVLESGCDKNAALTPVNSDAKRLEMALCAKFQLANVLHDAGILINPALVPGFFATVRSATPSVASLAQNEAARQTETITLTGGPSSMYKQTKSFGKVPKLRAENDPLASLVSSCQRRLGSPFPPSFSKLEKALESVKPSNAVLQQIAAEHVMLHMGSSKYRAKRFQIKGASEEDQTEEAPSKSEPSCESARATRSAQSASVRGTQQEARKRPRPPSHFEAESPHLRGEASDRVISAQELAPYLPCEVIDLSDVRSVGRWGESLVFNYLSGTLGANGWDVEWLNEKEEALTPYDLRVIKDNAYRGSRFIEVKASRYSSKNTFEISLNEFEFFSKNGGESINYDVYRVYCAGDALRVNIAVLENPLLRLREQKMHLCLAI